MTTPTSKSVAAAIGLNLLLPGLGYMYWGRWFIGIIGGALVITICVRSSQEHLLLVWVATNLIMAIDMCLLNSKRQGRS